MKCGVHQGYTVSKNKDIERRFECLDGNNANGLMLYFAHDGKHIEMKQMKKNKEVGLGLSKTVSDKNWYINDYSKNSTVEVLKYRKVAPP